MLSLDLDLHLLLLLLTPLVHHLAVLMGAVGHLLILLPQQVLAL